ncbi:DUF3352 domain-containing protein [Alistipes sp. OttesenSCG-928-L06]|nr:DUF3352 domain-containing protein [Alistipes sp. OttesenSCG-928-L06]
MEEHTQQPEIQQPPQDTPPLKKTGTSKVIKRAILFAALLLAAYFIYSILGIFLSPDRRVQQIYLIPRDAVFIVQADRPVEDWKTFSTSAPWQKLKQAPTFAEIAERADYLDSLLQANKTLLSLVGQREMMISVHKTRTRDWDFLMVIDLQKASKLDLLKDQIEQIYKAAGQQVTERKYNSFTLNELRDPDTRDILYTAFVDNHFVASYSSRLVESAIDEREDPQIGREYAFMEVDKLVAGKGLCRIYINYAYLPQYLTIYLGGRNPYIDQFSASMSFAGLYSTVEKDRLEVKGYSLMRDEVDPYVSALLASGTHKMRAHEILSGRTALYVNLGFSDVKTFVGSLEKALSEDEPAAYNSYKSGREKIEKYFDLSLDEHFLGWMSGEFALSQSEPGLLGSEPELILAVRANSIKDARRSMSEIEKKIKRRTPVSIKAVSYKGYEVNYIELKGFFKLFFGGLFEKFETPFYTYVGDYVVFSNKSASLLSFIEDYEQKNLLANDDDFKRSYRRSNASSTIFTYIDMLKFYGQLPGMLNAETWREVSANREVLYSFPQWTFQLTDEGQKSALHYVMDYKPYVEPALELEVTDILNDDAAMDDDAETERELMNELKRFYVEKFEGNILREFYPSGALQSEAEVKNGKRHGRYREYYEDGTLKLRGKYAANRPRGTWKYYTEQGKFDRREKY